MLRFPSSFDRLARCPWCAVALVGLLAAGGGAGFAWFIKPPVPWVHDEFSYLLAADTFAHGRLTNPPHPMRMHFESFHIITEPTYASKYPPAQGMFLAAGQKLAGHPLAGVWLSVGLAAAAITWMLQAWLPPRWALVGGLVAALRMTIPDAEANVFTTIGYWSRSYWGGAVAAIGGALVFGSLRRLVSQPKVSRTVGAFGTLRLCTLSVTLGVGLAILANSRPFEGLIVSLPVAVYLLVWLCGRNGPALRTSLVQIVLPLSVILTLAAAWIGYYNFRVTGDPFHMPFQVHEEQYRVAPLFLWQKPHPTLEYHHVVLRQFHTHDVPIGYERQLTWPGLATETLRKLRQLIESHLGWLLVAPLVVLPWMLRECWLRFALLAALILIVTLLTETWFLPHYAAPMTTLIFLLAATALRGLNTVRIRGKHVGRVAVAGIVLASVASWGLAFYDVKKQWWQFDSHYHWHRQRVNLEADLARTGEKHLIIVRYAPDHNAEAEWVYNRADIDSATVVWAREMDEEKNRKLRTYFANRKQWLLTPDDAVVTLREYPSVAD